MELGLQTANENTGKLINRCYSNLEFENAVKILNQFDIPIVAHIMVGLPNETIEDTKKTISFINNQNIWGLKIHSTYITLNTTLHQMFIEKKYSPISLDDYIFQASYILTHINPKIIIHRISGDAPKDTLIQPEWNLHKKLILNGIEKYMKQNDFYQGCFYENY